VAPPRGRTGQPGEPRGLRGDAVDRDELLLLADGVDEAERVPAEPQQPHEREHEQAAPRHCEHPRALSRAPLGERQEREQQPGADLHADPGYERRRSRPRTGRVGARAPVRPVPRLRRGRRRREPQREREAQQQQRVVVCPPDGEREQNGVAADECRRPPRRVSAALRGSRDQRDRREAGDRGKGFVDPHVRRHAERRERVAEQGEQRSIRGVLEGPPEKPERGVGGGFGGEVRIRVQPVQRAHAPE
jgi:hypothetical protein